MTPSMFEDKFCEFLQEKIANKHKLKGFEQTSKKELYVNPKVIKGYILPNTADTSEFDELPCIVFRMKGMRTKKIENKREHTLQSEIIIQSYCSGIENRNGKIGRVTDGSGYRDIWNVIDSIRQALFNGDFSPRVLIDEDSFEVSVNAEDMAYPIWTGVLGIDFILPIPDYTKNVFN